MTTKVLPAGTPTADPRLVGSWRGLSEKEEMSDAFLHFLKGEPGKPLRLVWVEGDEAQVYDVTTFSVGKRNVFAALPAGSLLNPPEAGDEDKSDYILGYYSMSGKKVSFSLLDPEKVAKLIQKGAVKGTPPASSTDEVKLSASPEELTTFLASEEAYAARGDAAVMTRLTKAQ